MHRSAFPEHLDADVTGFTGLGSIGFMAGVDWQAARLRCLASSTAVNGGVGRNLGAPWCTEQLDPSPFGEYESIENWNINEDQ